MISLFIQEQRRYSQNDLIKLFQANNEEIITYIKKLKEYGIIKTVKANSKQLDINELVEEDIEIVETKSGQIDYYYVFTFVGVIVAFKRIIKCYPKYISNEKKANIHLKQILKVLEKYNSKEQIIQMYNESDVDNSYNLLAIILYLINDYYEHGAYNNNKNIIELNGTGEILWDKTINESFTFITNNRPYFMELYTKRSTNNDLDYFKRLHETILSICFNDLQNSDLTELFDIMPIEISDEKLDDFGGEEEILYNLQQEINVQYNTRKQLVLKTMYTYIDQSNHLSDNESFSMFGTNSFNLVWEKVCSEVLNNQLKTQLKNLPISISGYNRSKKLIDIIEKPKWWYRETSEVSDNYRQPKESLIPDIVSIHLKGNEFQFIIFDAKYYNLTLNKYKLAGQPGIGDVTKQYLYQLAYQKIIDDVNINEVKNCFLMPTESDYIIDAGNVSMDMLDSLNLTSIQIRLLPTRKIFSNYLRDKQINIDQLNL